MVGNLKIVQNFKNFYKCQSYLGILSSQNVSCGNHEAHSCQDCPFVHKPTTVTSTTTTISSTEGNGATWCNGDCIWSNNQCVAAEAGQEGSGSSNLLGIPILNDQLAPEYNDDKIDEYDQEGVGTTSNLLGVPIINDNLAPEYQGFGGRPQSPGFDSRPQVQSSFRSKPQRPGFGGRPPQVQGGVGTSNSYNYDYAENYGDNYNEQELKDYLGSGYNEAIARSWNSSIGDFKNHTPEWWKNYLSPEVYRICREKGTEPSGSGKYDKFNETGIYYCNCCGHDFPLFSSDAKYDSGTGWPSFWAPISNSSVSYGEQDKQEVLCSRCEGHLGHVFNDGPANKTGKRFCMNSLALHFVPQLEVDNFYSNLN